MEEIKSKLMFMAAGSLRETLKITKLCTKHIVNVDKHDLNVEAPQIRSKLGGCNK